MATGGNPSTSDLVGFFKDVYSSELLNLVPDSAKLVKEIPFESRDALGGKYRQCVIVSEEAGFSYAPSGAGAFAVGNAISMLTQDAQIDGFSLVLQSALDYESAARASNGKKAFAEVTGLKVKNMLASTRKRLEASMWYGQTGLGKISVATNPAAGTSTVVTITEATHAPLLWAGKKGSKVVVYNGTTKIGAANFTIGVVDVSDTVRTVELIGTNADVVAVYAVGATTNYDIYFDTSVSGTAGSFVHNDMMGLDKQITTAASKFNIDPSTYDLWKGGSFAVGGAISFKKVLEAVAVAVNRGLDSDITLWLHPKAWTVLMNDQAALRQFDSSYSPSKADVGHQELTFFGINGKITIKGHGMIKAGEAFLFSSKDVIRVGATDVSFETPGRSGEIFFHDPSYAGYYFRLYSHQAICLLAPAKAVKLTGITYA